MKHKWAGEEAPPCSSLFSLSVSKLHQSLRLLVEPNLRHLVLVAKTLRRFQGETQPGPALVLPSEGSLVPRALACNLSEPSWRLMPPASLSLPMGDLLLSDVDSPAFLEFLEDV